MNPKPINELSHDLIDAAIEVQQKLGRPINFNARNRVEGTERVSNIAPDLSAVSATSASKK